MPEWKRRVRPRAGDHFHEPSGVCSGLSAVSCRFWQLSLVGFCRYSALLRLRAGLPFCALISRHAVCAAGCHFHRHSRQLHRELCVRTHAAVDRRHDPGWTHSRRRFPARARQPASCALEADAARAGSAPHHWHSGNFFQPVLSAGTQLRRHLLAAASELRAIWQLVRVLHQSPRPRSGTAGKLRCEKRQRHRRGAAARRRYPQHAQRRERL